MLSGNGNDSLRIVRAAAGLDRRGEPDRRGGDSALIVHVALRWDQRQGSLENIEHSAFNSQHPSV